MAKINVQGDPTWAAAAANIASLFDPKAQAEGDLMRSRRTAFDSETRFNNARASGQEDQNTALGEAALAAAGYTPMEIAAIRAARSNSVADVMRGVNFSRGREMLPTDARQGSLLLGIEKAGDKNFAGDDARADAIRSQDAAWELANTVAGASARAAALPKPVTLGPGYRLVDPNTGSVIAEGAAPNSRPVSLGAGGVLIDPVTGQVIASNDPRPVTLGTGSVLVNPQTGEQIAAGPAGTTALSPGQTLVNRADGSTVAAADPTVAAQSNDTRAINDLIISALGGIKDKKTGNVIIEKDGVALPLNIDQVTAIQRKAKELGANPQNYEQKVQEAAQALGINLGVKEDVLGPSRLFGLRDGKQQGFKFQQGPAPVAPAAKPAPAAPAAPAAAAPVPPPPVALRPEVAAGYPMAAAKLRELTTHPQFDLFAKAFDEKYGPGAAAAVLGSR